MDADTKSGDGDGKVSVNFKSGALLLIPMTDGAKPVRLVWNKKDRSKTRPVPPGRYRIKNYNLVREHKGETWIVSGSGASGQIVKVTEGRTTPVKISETLLLCAGARRMRGNLNVSMAFQGDSKMGITVLKGEKQTKLAYAIFNGSGRQVGKGELTYG